MKRFITVLLIFLIALTSYGCSTAGQGYEYEYTVTFHRFFVNGEYLATGDENVPSLLEDQGPLLTYVKKPIEGEQYEKLLEMLREVPDSFENAETMINDSISFNGVMVEGGTVYVDISGDGLSGSSLVEGLLISQIVNSFIATFEEIESVQFLVDGEEAETLMGHYDVTEPYVEGIYNIEK